MFGIGFSELIVIVVIGLVLFGTPVLTFVLGYTMGRKAPLATDQDATTDVVREEAEEPTDE